jgi:hypothetical protein
MKRPLQLLMALCLAGSLLLGGFAGLSPLLHVWLEHGGHGLAHVHHGPATATARSVENSAPVTSPSPSARHLRIAIRPAAERAHRFQLPSVSFAKLWHRWLQEPGAHGEAPEDSAPRPDPGHHHDSLAQTLAGGLLDVASAEHAVPGVALREFQLPAAAHDILRSGVFDPHSSERGPPAFPG